MEAQKYGNILSAFWHRIFINNKFNMQFYECNASSVVWSTEAQKYGNILSAFWHRIFINNKFNMQFYECNASSVVWSTLPEMVGHLACSPAMVKCM